MMEGMQHLRAFREAAQKASFARSATALGLSKATVSKYIAHLENTLGVRLLNRSTRAVTLTEAGRLLLARSTPLIDMMEETAKEAQGHASHPQGVLRVSAPLGLMQTAMPGILAQFMVQYPEVHLSVLITNRTVNLVEEGVDASMCREMPTTPDAGCSCQCSRTTCHATNGCMRHTRSARATAPPCAQCSASSSN
jgi:DNA-binding transcriptional LysR family regulator